MKENFSVHREDNVRINVHINGIGDQSRI